MIGLAMMLAVSAMQPITSPPARAGQCRWVRGRYRVYNGSSIRRIWIIGTTRIVAMRDDDPHEPPMIRKHGVPGNSLYGQFLICARERSRPGQMQHVRITATNNIAVLRDRHLGEPRQTAKN
ncbi:hypothetical protein [Sphingomonas sp.]|uniref:hypothetical protein n=1 Tax=Sphingomonas sp. TaxID=28214 RepID=UPI003F6F3C25